MELNGEYRYERVGNGWDIARFLNDCHIKPEHVVKVEETGIMGYQYAILYFREDEPRSTGKRKAPKGF